jgi:hypothetical protein
LSNETKSIWINECYYLNNDNHIYTHYSLDSPNAIYFLIIYKSLPFILNNTTQVIEDLIFAGITVNFYAVTIILIYPCHNICLLFVNNYIKVLSVYCSFIEFIRSSNTNNADIFYALSV